MRHAFGTLEYSTDYVGLQSIELQVQLSQLNRNGGQIVKVVPVQR